MRTLAERLQMLIIILRKPLETFPGIYITLVWNKWINDQRPWELYRIKPVIVYAADSSTFHSAPKVEYHHRGSTTNLCIYVDDGDRLQVSSKIPPTLASSSKTVLPKESIIVHLRAGFIRMFCRTLGPSVQFPLRDSLPRPRIQSTTWMAVRKWEGPSLTY